MNKTYYRLLATKPKSVFIPYLVGIGSMTAISWMIAPYSASLLRLAWISLGMFLAGIVVLLVDYRRAKRMTVIE